jgi:hypothetical protein
VRLICSAQNPLAPDLEGNKTGEEAGDGSDSHPHPISTFGRLAGVLTSQLPTPQPHFLSQWVLESVKPWLSKGGVEEEAGGPPGRTGALARNSISVCSWASGRP